MNDQPQTYPSSNTQGQPLLSRTYMVAPLAVICAILWGTAFPGVKIGYELFQIASESTASQMLFAGVRFMAAGILTLLFSLFINHDHRIELPTRESFGSIFLLGLINTTGNYFFYYIAIAHLTGGKSAILNSTSAFLGVLLSQFFFRYDHMNWHKAAGCLIGFAGVVIVNLNGDLGGFSFSLLGEGSMIAAATLNAIASIYSKSVSKGRNVMTVTGWQLGMGGFVLLLIGLFGGGTMQPSGPSAWLLLCYLSMLSATAFTLWTLLFKYNAPAKISIYKSLVPVFGTISSAIFLHEQALQPRTILALLLVCAGIYVVNIPKKGVHHA